jgi:hypothetical protein
MREPRIIELDPLVWSRGDGCGVLLYHGDSRRQCCIGVACTSLGVVDNVIEDKACLYDIDFDLYVTLPPALLSVLHVEREDEDDYEYLSDVLSQVYRINDDKKITDDAVRVRLINEELERLGASFRFTLKHVETGNQP